VTINPVNNFEAKAPDGTTLQQVLLGCNSIRAGGTIAPGENLSGDICYRAGSGGPFTISFRSPQDGTLVVTWQIE
jgi:hypothetical protein